MTADELRLRLQAALMPRQIDVTDDSHLHAGHRGASEGRHFSVQLVSERFTGLSRVARHRLVYDSLGSLSELGIHALAIVALTPDQADAAPADPN